MYLNNVNMCRSSIIIHNSIIDRIVHLYQNITEKHEGLAPMAVEKIKILGDFAQFLGKWAKLAVLFSW